MRKNWLKSVDPSAHEGLIDTLAAFEPPVMGETTLTLNYQNKLDGILAASL